MDSQKKIYMLGVGGISMYAIALFFKKLGREVRGYDSTASLNTTLLEKNGIVVDYDINESVLDGNFIVVYTGAIKNDNRLMQRAKEMGISIYTRAQALGYISRKHKTVIAVAGCHGKSTTTALLGEIFMHANKNPSLHIGAFSKNLEESFLIGDSEYFITEACEYENSFLMLNPEMAVVLNIDKDHLDFFKTFDNLKESFKSFMSQSKLVIVNAECPIKFEDNLTFGTKKSNFLLKKCKNIRNYRQKLIIYKNNKIFGKFVLGIPYRHNAINSLAAIAVSDCFGIDKKTIGEALQRFKGVKRRFEKIGITKNGAEVFVDYAHHPSEINETLKGTRKLTRRKIIAVFQPHTYSRTKLLFPEFVNAFGHADEVYIFETFSAREKYMLDGSARTLYKHLLNKKPCKYFSSKKMLISELLANSNKKTLILIMGAGNINMIADSLI